MQKKLIVQTNSQTLAMT